MSEKIKRFIEVFVPNTACNFKCSYCYLAQTGVLLNKTPEFKYDLDVMLQSVTKQRLGGACMFNIVADGETMLCKETMEFILGLLKEGHYVNIVTNATLKNRFDEMLSWPEELLKRVMLLVSFHYLELKRTKKLDVFFDNIKRAQEKGCSFYLSMVFCQEYIECMDEIKRVCLENLGVLPQPARVRNENDEELKVLVDMEADDYYNLGIFEFSSPLFQLEKDLYLKKIESFCYAGDWFVYLNLCTGELRACYNQPILGNLFENPEQPIKFRAIGNHCKCPYCYNGISRIPLGVIPEFKDVGYYWEYRNRTDDKGTDTITEFMKDATSIKFFETNQEYTKLKKMFCNILYEYKNEKLSRVVKQIKRLHPLRVKNKIIRIINSK